MRGDVTKVGVIERLVPGLGRPRAGYHMPLGWWYYAKKRFALYPGIVEARSAAFLAPYYAGRQAEQSPLRLVVNAITYAGFKLWAPWRARQIGRRYRLDGAWMKSAAAIAGERFADPNDIALYRIAQPSELDDFIRRFEHSEISKRVNPRCWDADCVLGNKIEFYARCVEFNLPHPQVFATAVDGVPRVHAVPEPGLLAVKPAGGEGGSGFRLESYAPGAENNVATFTVFLRRTLDNKHLWVVQDRIATHLALTEIALAALPTARIVTMINEEGEPEIVVSVLRFASDPKSHVDNIKSGGLMAPIDLETGILGPGCKGKGVGDFSTHPVSGGVIEGRQLPFWPEAKALVLDAHGRAFPEYNLIGWDVALTPDGPILIEGNGKPCMIVAQRAPRMGIGKNRYGALIAYHLAR